MVASFADGKQKTGQPRGGTVGEEARTGKRFPLELPIKIHKGEPGGDAKGITGNLERGRGVHPRRFFDGNWFAGGV